MRVCVMQQLLELPPGEYAHGGPNGAEVLYSQGQWLVKLWASATVVNNTVLRNSSLTRLLNDSA